MKKWLRLFLVVMLMAPGVPSVFAGPQEFRLGIISEKPTDKKIERYAPIAGYVAEHLKQFGVTSGKIVVANNLREMLGYIRDKKVDVVLDSPFNTITMQDKAGMSPRLLVRKHGVSEYRSIVFVRKESAIRKLSDLKGKVIALQDPESTSAYLLPMAELLDAGLTAVPADKKGDPAAVRFVLVKHERNQAARVLQKKADAAAFSSDDWDELNAAQKSELRIIHETKPVVRYIASFHPALTPEMTKAISGVLTGMDRDPAGRKILSGASDTSNMEPLSDKNRESLNYVKRLMEAVKKQRDGVSR